MVEKDFFFFLVSENVIPAFEIEVESFLILPNLLNWTLDPFKMFHKVLI